MRKIGLRVALCILLLCFALSARAEECSHDQKHPISDPIEPTCTQAGYRSYYRCDLCGEIVGGEVIPPRGHDYNSSEWIVQWEATCATPGRLARQCMRCGQWETKETEKASDHSNIAVILPGTPATCTQPGTKDLKQCAECGAYMGGEEIAPLGHNTDGAEWIIRREATCVREGVAGLRCNYCGAWVETQLIPKTADHRWLPAVEEQAPTCTEHGYSAIEQCADCGQKRGGERLEPGHAWGEWQFIVPGACQTLGVQQRVCSVCGVSENREAYQHGGIKYTTLIAPNCVSSGVSQGECVVCGNFVGIQYIPPTGVHTFEIQAEYQAPTCTQPGAGQLEVCSVCGFRQGSNDPIPALGHDLMGWELALEATCGAEGLTVRNCARCGEQVESQTIAATGKHAWETIAAATATCAQSGVTAVERCAVCGAQRGGEPMDALGHALDGAYWEPERFATCAEEGENVRRCVRCGEIVERKTIAKRKYHTDAYGSRVDDSYLLLLTPERSATCTQDGVTALYQCPTCGAQVGGDVLPAGHAWGEWEIAASGDCEHNGQFRRVCSVCGAEDTKTVGLGHQWETLSRVEPACEINGREERRCAVCGAEESRVLPANGHQYDDYLETTLPTCGEDGKIVRKCMNCGKRETLRVLPATGEHSYRNQRIAEPTCIQEGLRVRTCLICGLQTEPQVIPAYGHDYNGSEWMVQWEATCATPGRLARQCMRCGLRETKETEKASDHSYISVILPGTPATCTQPGTKDLKQCAECGVYMGGEEIPAPGHDMRLTAVEHPTCTQDGRETYACARCGGKKYETLPAAHAWGGWENDPEDSGLERRICLECGQQETRQKSGAEVCRHPYLEGYTFLEPGCLTAGILKLTCRQCGWASNEEIPALGHDFSGGVTETIPATCVSDGRVLSVCDRCGWTVDTGHTLAKTGVHTWETEAAAIPATCTASGTAETLKCASCDARKGGGELPALGHDFGGEWKTVLAPSCAAEGQAERACSRCGQKETKALEATGIHDWQVTAAEIAPTCTAPGSAKAEACAVCGAVRGGEELPAVHAWGVWSVLRPATCETPALLERVCGICGTAEQKTEDSAHQWEVVREEMPTCEAEGVTEMQCALCGKTQEKHKPARGHVPGEWIVTEPTCAATGSLRQKCANCGQTIENRAYGEPSGVHQYEPVEFIDPTCTQDGVRTTRCVICGLTNEKALPALGHDTNGAEWIIVQEATCDAAGMMKRQCIRCNELVETVDIPAAGHRWNIKLFGQEPTCTAPGTADLAKCAACGLEQGGEVLPALGHDIIVHIAQAATAEADGLEERLCSRCELRSARQLPATGKILSLPALLTEVEDEAFAGISAHGVTVPGSVTAIGAHAFENCAGLVEVRMPDSVTSIGDKAFDGCPDLWFLCESDNAAADYARRNNIPCLIEE